MSSRLQVVSSILRSPTLRGVEAAYVLYAFGGWSTYVAVIIYAFGRGGAAEAGIVAFVELAPSVIAVPAIAGLGDRYPRARVLLGVYVSQAIFMGAMAVALALSLNPLVIYAMATASATSVSFSRPVHASLLPEIVESPDDLTAANVVSGMAESSGSLFGPLGAGLLVALGGPVAVFAVGAICAAVASAAVFRIARSARSLPWTLPHADHPVRVSATIAHVAAGVSAIGRDRRLRSVVAIAVWAMFLVGALDIFYAVLAIDLLDLGDSGVGYLGALLGLGATIGAGLALLLVGRERLAIALGTSAALYGLGVAGLAVAPGVLTAAALLVSAGIGSGLTAVGAQTMIQRLAGDDVLSRVFGVLQGLGMGATALGSLCVPVLIGLVGERPAIAVAGVSLPLAFLALGRAIRMADRMDPERAADLRLLRAVPMLGPLSAPVLERLATAAVRIEQPAGTTICRTGDPGDRFYVIADGDLDVNVRDRPVRVLRPGDAFGEIALLRDVPRTATVIARSDATVLAIEREPFLAALTGQPRSRTIATGLADQRLAADHTPV